MTLDTNFVSSTECFDFAISDGTPSHVQLLLTTEGYTFDDGVALCEEVAAQPLIIRSAEEHNQVKDAFNYQGIRHVFIGARANALELDDEGTTEAFTWIDGSLLTYGAQSGTTPWAAGEPNNINGIEACIEMNTLASFVWNDLNCSRAERMICTKTCPTESPTQDPTLRPTQTPTEQPTRHPTVKPTHNPTSRPTRSPTKNPTGAPAVDPTETPTGRLTVSPTSNPTLGPTKSPSSDLEPAGTSETLIIVVAAVCGLVLLAVTLAILHKMRRKRRWVRRVSENKKFDVVGVSPPPGLGFSSKLPMGQSLNDTPSSDNPPTMSSANPMLKNNPVV